MPNKTNQISKSLFFFLWHFVKQQWPWILTAQIFALAYALDQTLFPYVIGLLIDGITSMGSDRSNMWEVLAKPIVYGISLLIIVELFNRLSGFILAYRVPKFEASVRTEMFDYVQGHSYSYFNDNFAGSIANKIADMPRSSYYVVEQIIQVFIPVLVAFIISFSLFANLQPLFAYILLAWFTTHIGICLICSKKCDRYAKIHSESRSVLSGAIVDSLINHLNGKIFSRLDLEKDHIERFQRDEIRSHRRSMIYMEKIKVALGILVFFGPAIGINWFMLYEWQHDRITTGDVIFIFNTMWNMTNMAWLSGLEMPGFIREIGVCRQALSLIQENHGVTDVPNAPDLKVTQGKIIFEDVTFQYSPSRKIFCDKSVTIQPGEKVGLVGFSGSGKTTFVHLILRYFDLNKGRILIDGQDISKVTQSSLRSNIAMIPQDTTLYHRSILENIRCGRPDATDEEVFEASKQAHCHEFIQKMPQGYDTMSGERGVKLSGGQRQRIAIARAVLKSAPILILDEATSALDTVTEKLIQESLSSLMEQRTTIAIAHRLSTLSNMDRILVFKEGEIVEEGSHEALLSTGGHYAHMWEMQAGGFLPESSDDD